ncbi:MAG: hypothetical protein U0869_12605 [Chloroflexota bacterium]
MRHQPVPPWRPDAVCTVCGQPLAGDPDDQPDHPAGPICGACVRAREFDETLWERDLRHEDGW